MTAATEAASKQPLDEIMLAMDVVDTLRRRERLVKKELDVAGREQDLKERLRKIYHSQGIEVPDHILEQGVKALKEDRFVYQPPPGGLATKLARLYVTRNRWGKWVGGGAAAAALATAGYYFVFVAPDAALPEDLAAAHREVVAVATTDNARNAAGRYLNAGRAALSADDGDQARTELDSLRDLRRQLEQEYTVTIVNRPGQNSGVWRIPDVNTQARNYYLIVEGIDVGGKPVEVAVTNEETNKTETVSQWGLRVGKSLYQRVTADKKDDGIIQRDRVGYKPRGQLVPNYDMPVSGGAITQW